MEPRGPCSGGTHTQSPLARLGAGHGTPPLSPSKRDHTQAQAGCRGHSHALAYIELPEPAGSPGCSLNSASVPYTVCCTSPSPICPSIHQSPTCPSAHRAESQGKDVEQREGWPASEGSSSLPDPVLAWDPSSLCRAPCQVVGTEDSPCLLGTRGPATLLHSQRDTWWRRSGGNIGKDSWEKQGPRPEPGLLRADCMVLEPPPPRSPEDRPPPSPFPGSPGSCSTTLHQQALLSVADASLQCCTWGDRPPRGAGGCAVHMRRRGRAGRLVGWGGGPGLPRPRQRLTRPPAPSRVCLPGLREGPLPGPALLYGPA